MSNLLEAALAYSAKGWWVLPLLPKGKRPALDSWKEYTQRKPTEEEIRRWWGENPEYNVGFVTGRKPNLCVLDIDDSSKAGKFLEQYPTGMVARSGKGGFHLYYKYPSKLKGILPNSFPGEDRVDFRGDNGIIVAPPSIHANSRKYAWVRIEDSSDLPWGLVNRILPKAYTNGTGESKDWVGELLRSGSPEGSRDSDGARLAGYFISKGIPEHLVPTLMLPWYEKTSHKDFSTTSLEKIAKSVTSTDARRRNVSTQEHVQGFSLFTAGAEQELRWTIEDWLPEGTTALMVAPPGNFKTWIMLAIALSVSTGNPLFGKYVVNYPSPVLIIQQEDARAILKQRLRTIFAQMCADAGATVEVICEKNSDRIDRIIIHNLPMPKLDMYVSPKLMRFSDQEATDLLEELIKKNGYKLIFFDPLYMSAEIDNYMSKAAQEMGVLKRLRDTYGTSFFVLHHTRKSAGEGTERMDAWGSQFINAWLETGIQIRPGPNPESVRIHRHYKSTKTKEQEVIRFDIDTTSENRKFKVEISKEDPSIIQVPTGSTDIDNENVGKSLLEFLKKGSRTAKELAEDTGLHETTIRKKLRRLTNSGMVRKNEDGTYSLA